MRKLFATAAVLCAAVGVATAQENGGVAQMPLEQGVPERGGAARRAKGESAVRVPTEDDVLSKILPTDSPYFYQRMMARYLEGDMTLTDDHYFYLYYGYAYDAEFDAHRELPGEGVMYEIFERTDTPTREEALAIIEAGRRNMTVDPFSPGNINMMTYAYGLAGDSIAAAASAERFRRVVRAIESSGTGAREREPWHILRFSHANDIVAAHGLTIANRQVRTRDVEYIQVERNPEGVKGYFFDFSRVYWKPYGGPRVSKKHKWMFNGTPM
ncbi:MAG: DUF4919 domain-containing protein [Alistipes sp.]|jgi:hypothetical protein|nr:DUF4919 domain-containing protein [Alistipes sp.]